MSEPSAVKKTSERLLSLDFFRGITIMGMILVNNPGSWEHIYPPLRHAAWHGCTFTDLIFPFFLFIVGVAMSFSFGKRREAGAPAGKFTAQIIRRTVILFALGLFLNWMPDFDIANGRIPGVLQRIALCYFFAGWMILYLSRKNQMIVTGILIVIYWIGMKFIPVPGHGAGVLEPEGNFCGYLDNLLLAGHTWKWAPAAGFDPEGVFSTVTALVSTLLGVFAGDWLRAPKDNHQKLIGLFVGGNLGLLVGYLLTIWLPLNKNLWTVSYVFYTTGFALHFLAMSFWLVDLKGFRKIAAPFVIFGSNAIFVYVLSSAVAKLMYLTQLNSSAGEISVKDWLFGNLFQPWAGDLNGSLFFALTYMLIWLGVTYLLYRKQIFIKV
jgi:predicted acyltransferase